jgi:virginiamycin B lyase
MQAGIRLDTYQVPSGTHPHDVAPAIDGGVWFTGQQAGYLGHLDPATGTVTQVKLGTGSAPHGVIVGTDGAAWVTDGGLNAIVRVDANTRDVKTYPLPGNRPSANLNTATFDTNGVLWFTGQNGVYGRLDPATGAMQVFDAPRGRGRMASPPPRAARSITPRLPATTSPALTRQREPRPYCEPPTPNQGARRVWSDSKGTIWVSEYNAGKLGRYDPSTNQWHEWPLPGTANAYSVYVDDRDIVWLSDFAANTSSGLTQPPRRSRVSRFPAPMPPSGRCLAVRARCGGAASGLDLLIVVRTGA